MDIANSALEKYQVGILLVDGFALLSYSSTLEPLRAANALADRNLYSIRNIPVSGAEAKSSAGAIVKADAQVGEQVDFDLVIVVAGDAGINFAEPRTIHWLRNLARRGVLLAGVSGGAVILARAGLMNGRRISVHWEHYPLVEDKFPNIIFEPNLFVLDRDRMTCAGGIAPLDMIHALITQHHGAIFARKVSDWFMHTEIRPAENPQRSGMVERYRTSNSSILQAIEAMETHISDPLELSDLANMVTLSERQLNRLFAGQMKQSTMAFYKDLRLKKARDLVARSSLSITDIALATGFGGSAHFAHAFRSRYATSPSALRLAQN